MKIKDFIKHMPLTNEQYSIIEREYDRRRLSHIRDMQAKTDAAYAKYPRLVQIDEEVTSLNMKKVRIRFGLEQSDGSDIDAKLAELSMERRALLTASGFKDGIIEPEYDCDICKDTGYVNGKKCSCFLAAEKKLIRSASNLDQILEKENFDTFSIDYYSDRIRDPEDPNGKTSKEAAEHALKSAKEFVDTFGEDFRNIYLYGKTGVGKTFLAHCIAKALIDKGVNVVFLTEASFIELLEDNQFHTSEDTKAAAATIFDCDLLIIDDFGANRNNSFVSSAILRVIDERYVNRKSTVITSNLTIEDLSVRYSDRIFSRIYSYYKKYFLFGEDIRISTK